MIVRGKITIVIIGHFSNFKFSYILSVLVWYMIKHYLKSSTGRMYTDNITVVKDPAAS